MFQKKRLVSFFKLAGHVLAPVVDGDPIGIARRNFQRPPCFQWPGIVRRHFQRPPCFQRPLPLDGQQQLLFQQPLQLRPSATTSLPAAAPLSAATAA